MVSENFSRLLAFAKEERYYVMSAFYFILIRVLDILSTMLLFLAYGGAVQEINPLGSFLISQFGHRPGLLISLVVTVPMVLVSAYILNKKSKRNIQGGFESGTLIIWGAIFLGFIATLNNFIQFGRGY